MNVHIRFTDFLMLVIGGALLWFEVIEPRIQPPQPVQTPIVWTQPAAYVAPVVLPSMTQPPVALQATFTPFYVAPSVTPLPTMTERATPIFSGYSEGGALASATPQP
jgi:hypothetical protein